MNDQFVLGFIVILIVYGVASNIFNGKRWHKNFLKFAKALSCEGSGSRIQGNFNGRNVECRKIGPWNFTPVWVIFLSMEPSVKNPENEALLRRHYQQPTPSTIIDSGKIYYSVRTFPYYVREYTDDDVRKIIEELNRATEIVESSWKEGKQIKTVSSKKSMQQTIVLAIMVVGGGGYFLLKYFLNK